MPEPRSTRYKFTPQPSDEDDHLAGGPNDGDNSDREFETPPPAIAPRSPQMQVQAAPVAAQPEVPQPQVNAAPVAAQPEVPSTQAQAATTAAPPPVPLLPYVLPPIPRSPMDVDYDLQSHIRATIERVPSPSSHFDFFIYVQDMRTILAKDDFTLWLIHPTTDEWHPTHIAWSRVASRVIRARIPEIAQPLGSWPSTTFEALQLLEEQSASRLNSRERFKFIPAVSPTFRPNEPLVSLITRIKLFVQTFSTKKYPAETAPPALVSFVSYLCWPALRPYFKQEKDSLFAQALDEFEKFDDFYNWLYKHKSSSPPTPPSTNVVGTLASLYVTPPSNSSSSKSRNNNQSNNNQGHNQSNNNQGNNQGNNGTKRKPNPKPSSSTQSNKGAPQRISNDVPENRFQDA